VFANTEQQAVGGMPRPRLRRGAQQPMELKEEVVRDGNHKVNSNGNPRIENSGKNKISSGNEVINKVNTGNEVVNKAKSLSSSECAVGSSCKYGTVIRVAPHPQ